MLTRTLLGSCLLLAACAVPTVPESASCGDAGGVTVNSVSAMIDGEPWVADGPQIDVGNGGWFVGTDLATFGFDAQSPGDDPRHIDLGIRIYGRIDCQTYPLEPSNFRSRAVVYGYSPDAVPYQAWDTRVSGSTGAITVTSFNSNGATGTFSFTAWPGQASTITKPVVVTNGVFRVHF